MLGVLGALLIFDLARRMFGRRYALPAALIWITTQFVADEYSIADIATWPWISRFEWQQIDLNKYPNVKRWYVSIANRPAVQKGYQVPKEMGSVPLP